MGRRGNLPRHRIEHHPTTAVTFDLWQSLANLIEQIRNEQQDLVGPQSHKIIWRHDRYPAARHGAPMETRRSVSYGHQVLGGDPTAAH